MPGQEYPGLLTYEKHLVENSKLSNSLTAKNCQDKCVCKSESNV